MKTYTLCADDYGFNQEISEGILELLTLKKINATSCMTNMPHWPQAAKQLCTSPSTAKIGLHLNLTDGSPLTTLNKHHFGSLKTLLFCSHLGMLNQELIYQEFKAQIDTFKKHYGKLPDFIDGHQHIHQFPIIRNAMLALYLNYFPNKTAAIRLSSNGFWQSLKSLKSLIITLTGALSLRNKLKKLEIPYNNSFSGAYNFAQAHNYHLYFPQFEQQIKPGGLIMCHPGKPSQDKNDDIAQARVFEYNYFRKLMK